MTEVRSKNKTGLFLAWREPVHGSLAAWRCWQALVVDLQLCPGGMPLSHRLFIRRGCSPAGRNQPTNRRCLSVHLEQAGFAGPPKPHRLLCARSGSTSQFWTVHRCDNKCQEFFKLLLTIKIRNYFILNYYLLTYWVFIFYFYYISIHYIYIYTIYLILSRLYQYLVNESIWVRNSIMFFSISKVYFV